MSEGVAGRVPEWYLLFQAARYLGVPPWALQEQSIEWYLYALAAMAAENEAAEALRRKGERKWQRPLRNL